MEEAVKPGVLPTYRRLRQIPASQLSKEEERIADLAQTSGWQALKDYIESLIGHLQAMEGVDASSTVEQVGFKYLATSVACAYLQAVIDRVEAVKKFFDEEEVKKNAVRPPEGKRRRIRP